MQLNRLICQFEYANFGDCPNWYVSFDDDSTNRFAAVGAHKQSFVGSGRVQIRKGWRGRWWRVESIGRIPTARRGSGEDRLVDLSQIECDVTELKNAQSAACDCPSHCFSCKIGAE